MATALLVLYINNMYRKQLSWALKLWYFYLSMKKEQMYVLDRLLALIMPERTHWMSDTLIQTYMCIYSFKSWWFIEILPVNNKLHF